MDLTTADLRSVKGKCSLTGLPTKQCSCWEFLQGGCTAEEARTAALEAVGIES